jgi:hypothetical protein
MNKIQQFEKWLSNMDNKLEAANKAGVPLIVEEVKYSNGYIPKIQYWTDKLMSASNPIDQMRALEKVRYFQKRHHEVYGEWPTMSEMINYNK